MPLPTGDVDDLTPPAMPQETGSGGLPPVPQTLNQGDLPPAPPTSAPAAGGTASQTEVPTAPFANAPAKTDSTEEAGTQIVTEGKSSQIQTVQASGPAALMQQAAEMGFDGVDLTSFGVFPIVSLHKETFKSTEGDILGPSFKGYPQGSRKKWIYRNGLATQNPEADFFYTYDDELTIRGELVEEKLAEWRQRGWARIKDPYVELFIQLAEGQKTGQVVALSIPKTSISRFSNFWMRLFPRGLEGIRSTLCEFGQGKEVTGPKIKNPWIPLDFKILS